ncbi:MAG: stretch-activated cation channel mid1 [Thelocarpon impressellum]|nr:MAG: stretch-activated cation channel mid1 [Thelocarpon impressellum]
MHFPALSPLQSRFAASLAASIILVLIYVTVVHTHIAYAADSISPEDHNHRRIYDLHEAQELIGEGKYEPNFYGADRGIIGRAAEDVTPLENNEPGELDIGDGQTQNWVFPRDKLFGPKAPATPGLPPSKRSTEKEEVIGEGETDTELRKRQQGVQTLHITLNTCKQPISNASGVATAPQLLLYVSQSPGNQKPGPTGPPDQQTIVQVDEGYGNLTLNATGDVYIGVAVAGLSSGFSGQYHYEVAASIDAPYHSYNDTDPNLLLVDTDVASALLITRNLTRVDPKENASVIEEWKKVKPPFVMFAHNTNDSAVEGLRHSYCGLKAHAQMATSSNGTIDAAMTTRGLDGLPKEQFFVKGLNKSSNYMGVLAMEGNSTAAGKGVVGGGGSVWKAMSFPTKKDGNCQILFDLPFCNDVAYAAPSNPTNRTLVDSLATIYDDNAKRLYRNFSNALALTACDAETTERYSLVRGCSDCAAAYKTWLCSVSIPRCDDFSSTAPHLRPRNVLARFPDGSPPPPLLNQAAIDDSTSAFGNQSRVPIVDGEVKPGPYKEVLPCIELCYGLVQNCPASLQFACPLMGKGAEYSYGQRSADGDVTCSFPGAAHQLSEGWCLRPREARWTGAVVVMTALLVGRMW